MSVDSYGLIGYWVKRPVHRATLQLVEGVTAHGQSLPLSGEPMGDVPVCLNQEPFHNHSIGGALARLAKTCPDETSLIPDHRTILNFRNILVHGYDKVEDGVVSGIVQAHLPLLRDTFVRLLREPQKRDLPPSPLLMAQRCRC